MFLNKDEEKENFRVQIYYYIFHYIVSGSSVTNAHTLPYIRQADRTVVVLLV